jgi:hypothetical protein
MNPKLNEAINCLLACGMTALMTIIVFVGWF